MGKSNFPNFNFQFPSQIECLRFLLKQKHDTHQLMEDRKVAIDGGGKGLDPGTFGQNTAGLNFARIIQFFAVLVGHNYCHLGYRWKISFLWPTLAGIFGSPFFAFLLICCPFWHNFFI